MARRYERDELLHLRFSPLSVRPKDLPPLEEWMGPLLDDKTKRAQTNGRSLRDGQGIGNFSATTRPVALDFSGKQHGRQGSNGDGAMKGMFSPGLRDAAIKSYDTPTRAGFGPLSPRGEQTTGMGRFGAGDREPGQGRDRAQTRFSALRASKDEGDSWLTSKITRRNDGEDGDRGFGRRGDRDQETGRDNGREHRRYGSEAVNDNIRNRDWRNNDKTAVRLATRDWNNSQEQDPEWMEEEKPVEQNKYTAEDFEAWKKSMRAQEAAAKGGAAPQAAIDEAIESAPAPAPKRIIETPLAFDAGEDKFFGLLGLSKSMDVPQPNDQPLGQSAASTRGGKSKFTNFFAVPEPQPVQQSQPILPHMTAPTPPQAGPTQKPPATEAEQVNFQRILDMLKAKSPAAPQGNTAFQAPPRHRTPPREATSTSATPPLVSPRPKSHGVQNFLNPQSPNANPDSQFLLNLMKAKDSDSQPPSYGGQYGNPHPQQPPFGQQLTSSHFPQHFDRNPEDRFLQGDFPPNVGVDKLNPSAHFLNQRRHGRMDSHGYDEHQPQHSAQHGPPPHLPPGFPPGLNGPGFPPGLGPMGPGRGGFRGPPGPGPGLGPGPGPGPGPGLMGAPPGFAGPGGPGGPGPFRGGNMPPGFGVPNMGGLNLGEDHGPSPVPPPGFNGLPSGMTRPPPGFAGRGGHGGMPMGGYDGRPGEQGIYGARE